MEKALKWFALISGLLLLCLFPGKMPQPPSKPAYRYVTRIEVTFDHSPHRQQYVYSQPQKLSPILNFLRLTDTRPLRETVQIAPGDHCYRLQLFYNDGSSRDYVLQNYRYFSKNGGPWQAVDPAKARLLYPILHYLPTDE